MRTWTVLRFIRRWLVVSLFLSSYSLYSSSWQQLAIDADRQVVLRDRYVLLDGNVDVRVDDRLRVTAPRLFADLQQERLIGHKDIRIKIHGSQSAQRHKAVNKDVMVSAQALDLSWGNNSAALSNAFMTGCSDVAPHWLLRARHARINDDWLTATGITGRIGNVPLFYVPWLSVPINSALAGSSLLPRLSYDAVQGVGLRHRLKYQFSSATSGQLGVNWRSRRGVVWHTGLKNGHGLLQQYNINGWYGVDRHKGLDRFTGQATSQSAYWIDGSGVYGAAGAPLLSAQVQYGSDKRVSETFFVAPSGRDDHADSVATLRWQDDDQVLAIGFRHLLQRRNQFSPTLKTRGVTQGNEQYSVRRVYYVPQVRWRHGLSSSSYPLHGTIEFGGDWTIVRSAQHDIVYDRMHSNYAKDSEGLHMGRLWCHGSLVSAMSWRYGVARIGVQPYLQARARGYAVPPGVGGLTAGCDAHAYIATLPARIGRLSVKPSLQLQRYDGTPALAAYHIDDHDRFAQGQLARMGVDINSRIGRIGITQGYALGRADYIFGDYQSNDFSPLKISFATNAEQWSWQSEHEYDWQRGRFSSHHASLSAHGGPLQATIGVDHYDPLCAQTKWLLFGGGTFVSSQLKWYPNAHWYCWYTSRWAYEHTAQALRGLHHDVGISYKGHCWELCAGYRENRYMQYGRQRKQCSYFLKLRLSPLGTIGTAFNRWVYE